MFKKTKKEIQLGIFSTATSFLSGRAESFYENQEAWHNLFRQQVIIRIDESICMPLFTVHTGAPNSAIRVLIGMMMLKEANGWSDEQLFEQGRYNLLVRSALGLMNTDDALPTESTYYLFRKRVVDYEKSSGINLIEKIFASVTKGQSTDFQVSGKSIRMDSKLLGSNIAWFTRYELIHETLRLFCKDKKNALLSHPSLTSEKTAIENLLKEKGNKVVYRSTNDEVKTKIGELGVLAYKLLQLFASLSSKPLSTLSRVFSEQFIVNESQTVLPRSKEDIHADSVQSPHDTDCHFRNKGDNKVKGYSINITESCDHDKLNLISRVDVRMATTADSDFLQDGISAAQEIFIDAIENAHTDGAYHSPENQEFCKNENINLLTNAIQGFSSRFDLSYGEDNQIVVLDTLTNENIPATKVKGQEKWRINIGDRRRYFTAKEITTSLLRKKIGATPQEILNIRNNVEATIFQLGYHYRHNKSRYRGFIKHKMWANIRCLWVNFVRIANFLTRLIKKNHFGFNSLTNEAFTLCITSTIVKFKLFLIKPIHC